MFAPELATIRTVEVEQFCSWSACRMKIRSIASTTSGSRSAGWPSVVNIMCRNWLA